MDLTERTWCDVLFYHPELPPVITRFGRDDSYIAALRPVLDEFVERLEAEKLRFAEHRVPRPWSKEPTS